MNILFEQAKNDPELRSTINIDELLEHAENVDHDYIGNHSLKTISEEVVQVLKSKNITIENLYKYCNSLINYRLIDEVHHIHKGKHIRWLRNNNLTNGGIVVDIKFTDLGTQILCKTKNKFFQYKFDDCITFQKLTSDELLILQVKDLL